MNFNNSRKSSNTSCKKHKYSLVNNEIKEPLQKKIKHENKESVESKIKPECTLSNGNCNGNNISRLVDYESDSDNENDSDEEFKTNSIASTLYILQKHKLEWDYTACDKSHPIVSNYHLLNGASKKLNKNSNGPINSSTSVYDTNFNEPNHSIMPVTNSNEPDTPNMPIIDTNSNKAQCYITPVNDLNSNEQNHPIIPISTDSNASNKTVLFKQEPDEQNHSIMQVSDTNSNKLNHSIMHADTISNVPNSNNTTTYDRNLPVADSNNIPKSNTLKSEELPENKTKIKKKNPFVSKRPSLSNNGRNSPVVNIHNESQQNISTQQNISIQHKFNNNYSNVCPDIIRSDSTDSNASNKTVLLKPEPEAEKKSLVKSKSDISGLEETMICTICHDLLYNCISIQPCLHTFCSICLLEWRLSGNFCPICRAEIEGVAKNYQLQSIIDMYAKTNTTKLKSEESRRRADIEVNKKRNILFASTISRNSILNETQNLNNCLICNYPNPADPNHIMPINPFGVMCTVTMTHTPCQCCKVFVPDYPFTSLTETNIDSTILRPTATLTAQSVSRLARNTSNVILYATVTGNLPQKHCALCNGSFCHILFGQCKGCQFGCLHIFKDFISNPNINTFFNMVPPFLPDNFFETSILRDYILSKGLSVPDMYTDILCILLSGNRIQLSRNITGESTVCVRCAKILLLEAVYQYRLTIPKSTLPPTVTARPNCCYGRNCRTQSTRSHHAIHYNHVCEQIRFDDDDF